MAPGGISSALRPGRYENNFPLGPLGARRAGAVLVETAGRSCIFVDQFCFGYPRILKFLALTAIILGPCLPNLGRTGAGFLFIWIFMWLDNWLATIFMLNSMIWVVFGWIILDEALMEKSIDKRNNKRLNRVPFVGAEPTKILLFFFY